MIVCLSVCIVAMYIYIYNFTYIYCNCTCKSNPHSECYCICDLEMQLPIVPCCQGAHNRVWQHNTVQYNTITILQYYNKASSQCINVLMYYCNAVLLHQCLFSSGRFSSASGLLWTPLDSAPPSTSQQRITRSPRPPVHRALPVFHFHFNITILQVCKFASRDSAERIPAVAAQAHNRTIHVSLYFISLCTILYLKLKLSNCQRSTLNDHTQRLHVTLPARIADSRSTSSRQEQETANWNWNWKKISLKQTSIHSFIHSFI